MKIRLITFFQSSVSGNRKKLHQKHENEFAGEIALERGSRNYQLLTNPTSIKGKELVFLSHHRL